MFNRVWMREGVFASYWSTSGWSLCSKIGHANEKKGLRITLEPSPPFIRFVFESFIQIILNRCLGLAALMKQDSSHPGTVLMNISRSPFPWILPYILMRSSVFVTLY